MCAFSPSAWPDSFRPTRNAASDVADSPGDLLLRNPITGIAGCCARAASGHAAAPPNSVMKSRRLMGAYPKARSPTDYSRFGVDQWRASQQKRAPLCADMRELASVVRAILIINASVPPTHHLCVCLKYLKSGGGWSFLAGINKPSALRK